MCESRDSAVRQIVLLGCLIFVAACAPATPGGGDSPGPGERPLAECTSPDEVGEIRLIDPEPFAFIGATGVGGSIGYIFLYEYEGGCWPGGGFTFHLAESEADLYEAGYASTDPHPPGPSGSTLEHRQILLNGRQYWWTVSPNLRIWPYVTEPEGPRPWRFFTGPFCDIYSLPAPELVSPIDGAMVRTLTPFLEYSYEGTGSCLPEQFSVDLSTDPGFSTGVRWFDVGVPAMRIAPAEPLLNCETYYWRVRAMGPRDERGVYSETWSFRTNDRGSCPSDSLVPTLAPLPGVLPTVELPDIRLEVLEDAICRSGPGTMYVILEYLMKGEIREVKGYSGNLQNPWLSIVRKAGAGECYVSGSLVRFPGVVTDLPYFDPPPVPTWTAPPPTEEPDAGPLGCKILGPNNSVICYPIAQCPVPFDKSLGACTP